MRIHIHRLGLVRTGRLLAAALFAALAVSWTAPAVADPPPWAPAHGYRAKQKHRHYVAYEPPPVLVAGRCNRTVLGGLLGGGAGAAVGAAVADGDNRAPAIIGGAIIGVLVGGAIGHHMDSVDQHCIGQALEHAPSGQTITWQNPDSGGVYQVTPARTYQRADGRYCREYVTEAEVAGRTQQVYGTACRQPDGSWKLGG